MPRKRDGFIPLGDVAEAVELPGGHALASRAVAPQALHHFTRLDQVTQLVGASEADPERIDPLPLAAGVAVVPVVPPVAR